MNTLSLCLLAVGASVASSFAVHVACCEPPAPAPTAPSAEPGALAGALSALEARDAELARALADLRALVDAAPRGEARTPVGEIDAAVERALDRRAGDAPAAARAAEPEPAPAEKPRSARDAFEALTSGNLSRAEREKLWKELRETGDADQVIALFEARAKERPDDPEAQLELGQAYLQKIFSVPDGPEKGLWAVKADQAFDQALALDDHNWEARFTKAVSLSFWPPLFGKQSSAIQNFETLVAQQDQLPQQPQFAETHLMLGNMYLQQGKTDKALAAWQKGLSYFPNHAQLAQQVASVQGQ